MKRYIFYLLFCSLIALSFSSCPMPLETGDNLTDSTGFTDFQRAVLDEINYIRTDPSGYAEERLIDDYNAGSDNGAYLDIRSRTPMGSLSLQSELCSAADTYAEYLAVNNVFGHYENGTPQERCEAAGYDFYSGENLAAGSYAYLNAQTDARTAAIEFVLMWIIDTGVVGVGHRENIMTSSHTHMGVGFVHYENSTYVNYAVQEFGREN